MIDTWAKLITQVGFPIFVAGILLYVMVNEVVPVIRSLDRTAQEQVVATREQIGVLRELQEASEENNLRLRQMMGDAPWSRYDRTTRDR